MATIKAYTDLEQSKTLAKILPLESADMLFHFGEYKHADSIRVPLTKEHWKRMMPEVTPCWSLAVLLDVLPVGTESHKQSDGSISYYHVEVYNNKKYFSTKRYNNLIDACCEMILKLNELNLL